MTRPLRWAWLALVPALAGCMISYVPSEPQREPAPARGAPDRGRLVPAVLAPASADEFVPSAEELRLGALLTGDRGQKRARLVYSPILARVARAKAEDMARRRYFGHTDPDGVGANTLVERAGYRLPAHYDKRPQGNGIESLGVGYASPEDAWRRWMGSGEHRSHLLGLHPAFAEQTEYGVGYASVPGRPREHYWVVLIARPAE